MKHLGNWSNPRGFRRVRPLHAIAGGRPPPTHMPVILAQDLNSQGQASDWLKLHHVALLE